MLRNLLRSLLRNVAKVVGVIPSCFCTCEMLRNVAKLKFRNISQQRVVAKAQRLIHAPSETCFGVCCKTLPDALQKRLCYKGGKQSVIGAGHNQHSYKILTDDCKLVPRIACVRGLRTGRRSIPPVGPSLALASSSSLCRECTRHPLAPVPIFPSQHYILSV